MLLFILGFVLWYLFGIYSFIYWYTEEDDLTTREIFPTFLAGFFGPIIWFILSSGSSDTTIIKRRKR